MLVYLLVFATFLCVLHLLFNYNKRARLLTKIPGPKVNFIVGNGLWVLRSPACRWQSKLCRPSNWATSLALSVASISSCGEDCGVVGEVFQGRVINESPPEQVILAATNRVRSLFKDFDISHGNSCSVDLMKLGRENAKRWKGIYRVWVWPFGSVVIFNPEDIELVMSSMKYGEKSVIYTILEPWLKDGLLLSNGTKWQDRRKILTPAFHFNILRQFCYIIEENTQRFLERLRQTAGQPIDVVPVLSEYTLNSICETAMGTQQSEDISGTSKSYKQAIYELGHIFYHRFIKIYLYPNFIFNASSLGRKQKRHIKTVKSFTEKVIAQRKAYVSKYGFSILDDTNEKDEVYVYKKKKRVAMLDLLLSAEKEGLIDKAGIQEEVDTFMFEGHDTTASGLTFFFMLLANHQDVQDKIVAELTEVFGDSNRRVCMEDLPKMKYTERCIKESLRLYPPVHFISRKLNETTILSNYTVPPETLCHIPIYDLHHSEDLFENPEEFDPDRFLPENCEKRHAYAYIPFSAGPRNCIGQKFAMLEMKIAVAEVLREFELKSVTKPSDIEFLADLVLRNNGPVKINFLRRQRNFVSY